MLPVYSALHFIPMLVLRRKHVMRDPLGMLSRALKGTLRSSSFLGVFVIIFQSESLGIVFFVAVEEQLIRRMRCEGILCFRTNMIIGRTEFKYPVWLKRLFKRKESFWVMGFLTCLSLFVEERVSAL
jgi:hypothetical protein